MKKRLVVLAAAFATVAFFATPAFADQKFSLTELSPVAGTASCPSAGESFKVEPIPEGTHEITVDASDFGGTAFYSATLKSGSASELDIVFSADGSTVTFTSTQSISHYEVVLCAAGSTTGGTTGETTGETTGTTGETTGTTGETTGTTGETTGTTGETSGGTTGTSGGTTGATSTSGSGGVSGSTTGGTTGGTAATPSGGNLPFTGLPVWIPLLAAAGMLASGIFLVRRRKGELS
jgi:hypothetical protein